MSDTPIWRQAIKQKDHPLNKIAWLLFRPKMNVKYATRVTEGQREAVMELLYEILDTDALYMQEGLGEGYAPTNAITLLGHWQVVEAVPRLLQIIEEEDWETIVHGAANTALSNMPTSVIPQLIAYAEARDHESKVHMSHILSDIAPGDDDIFDWVHDLFVNSKDKFDLQILAENLLEINGERAIPILEESIKKRRFDKVGRDRVEKLIKRMRQGKWDTIELLDDD